MKRSAKPLISAGALLITLLVATLSLTAQNSTPEELAKTLYKAFAENDIEAYLQYYPTGDDVDAIVEGSEIEKDKHIEKGYLNHLARGLRNRTEIYWQWMLEEAEYLRFPPSKAELGETIVDKSTEDGVQIATVKQEIIYQGESYWFLFDYCIASPRGWLVMDYPKWSISDKVKQMKTDIGQVIRPHVDIDNFTITHTDGMYNRIRISAEANTECDWALAIKDQKGKVVHNEEIKYVLKPRFIATLPGNGKYEIILEATRHALKDEDKSPKGKALIATGEVLASASHNQSLTLRNSPKGLFIHAWPIYATQRIDYYASQLPIPRVPDIYMARNESEAVQIAFLCNKDTKASLKLKDSKAAIKIYREGYLYVRPPRVMVPFTDEGWTPDALIPANDFDVKAGDLEVFWVEYTPAPGQTGLVEETFLLELDGQGTEIPVRFHVYDVDLPLDEPPMTTAFSAYGVGGLYGEERADEMYDSVLTELWNAYISPDHLYRSNRPLTIDEIKKYEKLTKGNTYSNLMYVHERNIGTWKDYLPQLEEAYEYIKENNLQSNYYFYTFDESPSVESFHQMQDVDRELKKRFPDIETVTTAWVFRYPGVIEDLPEMDHWTPLTIDFERYGLDSTKFDWWYICVGPPPPYANWFVESELIETRVLFWQSWQYDIDGFLYYASSRWPNKKEQIEFADFPCLDWSPASFHTVNGDGNLMYGGTDDILPSLRLRNIKEGMEDYALLRLAEEKAGKEAVMQLSYRISRTVSDYDTDPEELYELRKALLEILTQ